MKNIDLDVCIVNENELVIIGNSTAFANQNKAHYVDPMKLYNEVEALAKNNQLTIKKKNKFKKRIGELNLISFPQKYDEKYAQLKKLWQSLIIKDGDKFQLKYDRDLHDLAYSLRNELDEYMLKRNPFGSAIRIINELNNIKRTMHDVIERNKGKDIVFYL